MRILIKTLLFSFVSVVILSCSSSHKMIDNNTVKNLDINKYIGTWYEIARYPHSFEKNLVGVTANYTLNNDGTIKVINKGYKGSLSGKMKKAVGKAKIPDKRKSANLKVSFFWIFYSDYLVMELDEKDYQWAVVGSSSPNYLWILCREPQMSVMMLNEIKSRLVERGYDLSNLQMVPQHFSSSN
ncbi:MAG: lipocalin family protein [Bacteroidales bacterium]|jgi:apolipoprotein D and lipocalin family protein|nr:lipocalin family protein [Bacteroidales bacterium]